MEAGLNAQKEFAKNVLSGMTDEEKHMCMKDHLIKSVTMQKNV